MTMTEEDKKLISKYMGWNPYPPECMGKTVFYCDETHGDVRWDANAAGLCVLEMQKRGDVGSFIQFSWGLKTIYPERRNSLLEYIPYIFNAENFFNAMAQWIKEKKGGNTQK